MINNKYRVSFEITDNWAVEGFRNFIRVLLSDETQFEVYIISNDDSTSLIKKTGENLGLDEAHVIRCNFSDDKLEAIQNNKIDIHLDNLQSFVMLVTETTDAYGILITKNLNKYYLKPDYIVVFDRLLQQIKNEEK
jgi:hypothetical protein